MGSVLTLQVRLASVKCDVSVLKIIHPAAAQKTKTTTRHVSCPTCDKQRFSITTAGTHER